jgi:hypothetical protein
VKIGVWGQIKEGNCVYGAEREELERVRKRRVLYFESV